MYIFPIPEGEWSVEGSFEGYQATASTTDPNKDKQDGLIAYSDEEGKGWNVGEYKNVQITNNKVDNSWKYGHPDLEVNSCHFNSRQCLERDGDLSCHVKTTGSDAAIFVIGPPVQKQAKYNYAVSYGAWTDRNMELGLVTIVLDEKDRSSGSAYKRIPRVGHSVGVPFFETINHPAKVNAGDLQITGQRQDPNTLPDVDSSDSGSDPGSPISTNISLTEQQQEALLFLNDDNNIPDAPEDTFSVPLPKPNIRPALKSGESTSKGSTLSGGALKRGLLTSKGFTSSALDDLAVLKERASSVSADDASSVTNFDNELDSLARFYHWSPSQIIEARNQLRFQTAKRGRLLNSKSRFGF